MGQERLREVTDEELLARRCVEEILNGVNPDSIDELIADDVVVHGLGAGTVTVGREAFREDIENWRAAVPDSTDRIDEVVVEDDRVVLFCTRGGTNEGEFQGFAATGESFEISVVHKLRIGDEQVVEWVRLADAMGLASQLGLLPDSPGKLVRLMLGRIRGRFRR